MANTPKTAPTKVVKAGPSVDYHHQQQGSPASVEHVGASGRDYADQQAQEMQDKGRRLMAGSRTASLSDGDEVLPNKGALLTDEHQHREARAFKSPFPPGVGLRVMRPDGGDEQQVICDLPSGSSTAGARVLAADPFLDQLTRLIDARIRRAALHHRPPSLAERATMTGVS